jgi:hypothetical protein
MTTKPLLQKILQGILHIENNSIQNYEKTGSTNHRRRKGKKVERNIDVTPTMKPLNNKTTK